MTRVLHVIGGLSSANGGPSWAVPSLCAGLAATGLEVSVATPEGPGEADVSAGTRALTSLGVPLIALPKGASALRALLAEQQVVHVHGAWRPPICRVHMAARQLGVPVVLSPHGSFEPWAIRHKRLKKLIGWYLYQRRNVRHAAVLHAAAELERQSIARLRVANHVAVIPNPVDIPRLTDLPGRSGEVGRRRRALFLARIHPVKGLDLLLEAWFRVKPRGWELVIVGGGDRQHVALVEAQVRRLKLGDVVSFAGHLEGTAKWAQYRASDLFVLPSRSENFGLVVAEALAAETPVIATVAAPWAALPELGCGWSVPVSVEGIATALEQAVGATDEERRQMGVRGRRFVDESFSVATVARATRELYRWVLGEADCAPAFVHLPAGAADLRPRHSEDVISPERRRAREFG